MSIQVYKKDLDKFLVDVTLTAACYGLVKEVAGISKYLMSVPRAKGPALLANALANIVAKQYNEADVFLNAILASSTYSKFHEEAHGFKALSYKLQGDEEHFADQLSLAPSFSNAFSI